MKPLLLSLSVLLIGTTLNAQDAPNKKKLDQKDPAQQILELQKQIEKLVQKQAQLKREDSQNQSVQKKQHRLTFTGPNGTKSFSSGMIKIVGPDGQMQTFHFDPEQPGELKARSLLLGHVPQKPEFMIGIAMAKIPEGFHELIGIEPDEGVIVNAVMKGTPAEKAGLQKNDLILSLNGKKVTAPEQVQETIKLARGNKLTLGIRRGKESLNVELTPEKSKQPQPGTPTRILLNGLDIKDAELKNLDVEKLILDHNFVGPGVITGPGTQKKEFNALKLKVDELAKQQAEMKALLESVKELVSEQKK